MESTIAVMLLFLCMLCFAGINAKTNTAGNSDSNRLNSDSAELSSNELSTDIDNCHEACLQKVRLFNILNVCFEHDHKAIIKFASLNSV